MTTNIEEYDKIIEDNQLYLTHHFAMLENNLEPEMLEVVKNTLGQLEKWLEDIGDMQDIIVPVICYKHAIRSTRMMKEMAMETPEND